MTESVGEPQQDGLTRENVRPLAEEPPVAPVGISRLGQIGILSCCTFQPIAMGTVTVMLPALSDVFQHGQSGVQVGLIVTIAGLGVLVGAPAGGFLIDRIGSRSMLILAAFIMGTVGASMVVMNELWQLVVARLFIGLCAGAVSVALASLVGQCFADNARNRWLGYTAAVSTLSAVVFTPIVGALTDLRWNYGFLIFIIIFPLLILVSIGLPRVQHDLHSSPRAIEPIKVPLPIRGLLLAILLGTLSTGTSLYWPFRLREVGVETARDLAFAALPNVILIAAGALAYSRVRKRFSISRIFAIGCFGSSIGLAMMAAASSSPLVMAGLAIEGLAIGLMMPNLTAYALTTSPPNATGRNLGLVKGAFYGSPFLTQFILHPIDAQFGSATALTAIAAVSAISALGLFADDRVKLNAMRRRDATQ